MLPISNHHDSQLPNGKQLPGSNTDNQVATPLHNAGILPESTWVDANDLFNTPSYKPKSLWIKK